MSKLSIAMLFKTSSPTLTACRTSLFMTRS